MTDDLYIPGPITVRDEVLEVMKSPPYGHRAKDISERLETIIENTKTLLFAGDESNYGPYEIIVSTSSGTGLMEAAVRNCVKEKCLNVSIGAFGNLWHKITKANGKGADLLEFEWGTAAVPSAIYEKLSSGDYDAITVTHNETSTGTRNPLKEISKVIEEVNKSLPVTFMVDAVSSMGGDKIEVGDLGIDFIVGSSQKCMGLPPGIAIGAVSKRAMSKASEVSDRGFYFDLLEFKKSNDKLQTPSTPCEALIDALDYQLKYIISEEGLQARFDRHEKLARIARTWANEHFELFPDEKDASNTVTCIKNNSDIDLADLKSKLAEKGYLFDGGYRGLREKGISTFRIPHMGDRREEDFIRYLEDIELILNLG
ncbi:MAG: alanine--glyoxylate aminotransferase family protein [Halobacteriota archaeon]|nr:alanine--glyoxylate aminotransferase family protein [Halobacteriota archaeon]